jgi:hypothetical protein
MEKPDIVGCRFEGDVRTCALCDGRALSGAWVKPVRATEHVYFCASCIDALAEVNGEPGLCPSAR